MYFADRSIGFNVTCNPLRGLHQRLELLRQSRQGSANGRRPFPSRSHLFKRWSPSGLLSAWSADPRAFSPTRSLSACSRHRSLTVRNSSTPLRLPPPSPSYPRRGHGGSSFYSSEPSGRCYYAVEVLERRIFARSPCMAQQLPHLRYRIQPRYANISRNHSDATGVSVLLVDLITSSWAARGYEHSGVLPPLVSSV